MVTCYKPKECANGLVKYPLYSPGCSAALIGMQILLAVAQRMKVMTSKAAATTTTTELEREPVKCL